MIGATGVGKTEIARRLAKLASAPFYKVEASKFTEVGYVGKDAESMIRDLVEIGINMVRAEEKDRVKVKAEELAEERLLDILLPKSRPGAEGDVRDVYVNVEAVKTGTETLVESNAATSPLTGDTADPTREKMRKMLREGKLDQRKVELETGSRPSSSGTGGIPMVEIISAGGSADDISQNIRDMLGNMMPQGKKRRRVSVPEALEILMAEEAQRLVDMDLVTKLALERVQNNGIIFLDEIDKIASTSGGHSHGPEVSREGVQRDLLPIVEGSTVSTKYGFVKTDHILFIAAGAFHTAKPSDLIPELQGRFPIRVELSSLTKEDLLRILREPEHSLIKQYVALMLTENISLNFTDDAIEEIAAIAMQLNDQMENIGARRLHTIIEKVMESLSFEASDRADKMASVDGAYVRRQLEGIVKNQDLSRFIL
jgi:ATP-dependent HslUV protease ATP-binding subunit HslU